jgi:hypothetical protein
MQVSDPVPTCYGGQLPVPAALHMLAIALWAEICPRRTVCGDSSATCPASSPSYISWINTATGRGDTKLHQRLRRGRCRPLMDSHGLPGDLPHRLSDLGRAPIGGSVNSTTPEERFIQGDRGLAIGASVYQRRGGILSLRTGPTVLAAETQRRRRIDSARERRRIAASQRLPLSRRSSFQTPG